MNSNANYPKLAAQFFQTAAGNEPVREWLKTLDKEDRKQIGVDIQTVQFGWPLGMPLVRSLGEGLWEIRIKLNMNRIARVIFFTDYNTIILVNGFMKKSQKTPLSEIRLALDRKHDYEKNC